MEKLLNDVDTLFNIFVPGALCVWFYTKLALKKLEFQSYFVISFVVGFVVKHFSDTMATAIPVVYSVSSPFLIYIVVALLLAAIYYHRKNALWARKLGTKLFGVDTADNVWTRHIDFKCGTEILAYLDDGTYVMGNIENADEQYLVLTYHATATDAYGEDMEKQSRYLTPTALCIPMEHIKRWEFAYKDSTSPLAKFVLR